MLARSEPIVSIAVVDAMDQAAVDRHVDEVADAAGRIDIALNAVGFDHVQGLAIADTSLADYLHPVTGYLQTNFVTAKAVSRHMLARGSGVILTISTPGARLTGRGLIGNAAQSAGLEGFSRALAGELGPAGVRVVCVRPHAMADAYDTSYTGEMFGRIAALSGTPRDEWLDGLASTTLLGRLPTLDEVAEYLAFAASDRARSMTGVDREPDGWGARRLGHTRSGPDSPRHREGHDQQGTEVSHGSTGGADCATTIGITGSRGGCRSSR